MSAHEPNDLAAGIPLKALVEELRSRCESVARLQGGSTYYIEELGIFRDCARHSGHLLASPPTALSSPPDDEGNEHKVWFLEESNSFLKATWPGFFGLLVIHRPHEEAKVSPVDHLERWSLPGRHRSWMPYTFEINNTNWEIEEMTSFLNWDDRCY